MTSCVIFYSFAFKRSNTPCGSEQRDKNIRSFGHSTNAEKGGGKGEEIREHYGKEKVERERDIPFSLCMNTYLYTKMKMMCIMVQYCRSIYCKSPMVFCLV